MFFLVVAWLRIITKEGNMYQNSRMCLKSVFQKLNKAVELKGKLKLDSQ